MEKTNLLNDATGHDYQMGWLENIGPSVKCSDCFEPVNQPEDGEYKRGFIDGWVKCTDYFIKHELNKEDDIYG